MAVVSAGSTALHPYSGYAATWVDILTNQYSHIVGSMSVPIYCEESVASNKSWLLVESIWPTVIDRVPIVLSYSHE